MRMGILPPYFDLPRGTVCTVSYNEWESDEYKPFVGAECVVVGINNDGLVLIMLRADFERLGSVLLASDEDIISISKQSIVCGEQKMLDIQNMDEVLSFKASSVNHKIVA